MTTPDVHEVTRGSAHPCNHGYFLHDCALCVKRAGECDYGSCTALATTTKATLNGRGQTVELRPMCADHA